MDFGSVFAAPVVETIAGARVVFPLLECDELAPFTAEIRADRVDAATRHAESQKLNTVQTYQARVQAENRKVTVTDVIDRIMELQPSGKVCRMSLAKAGHSTAAIDGIMRMMPLPLRGELAIKVASIAAPLPADPQNEGEREINTPLALGATGPSAIGSNATPPSPTRSPALANQAD